MGGVDWSYWDPISPEMLLFSHQDAAAYFGYQKAVSEMPAQNGAIEQPR